MSYVETMRNDGPHEFPVAGAPGSRFSGLGALPDTLMHIDCAVRSNHPEVDCQLANILAAAVHDRHLLDGLDLSPSRERYTRHLLHQGRDYSVIGLVWMPGQMSSIHCHRTWCVLAVQCGWLMETQFSRGADRIDPIGGRQLFPGDVSHSQPDMKTAHRMANLGCTTAVSIHVYGAAFERLGQDVNHIWSD